MQRPGQLFAGSQKQKPPDVCLLIKAAIAVTFNYFYPYILMKGRSLIFTALLVLAAGIVLIITHASIRSTGVVTTGGILFILAGVLNMLVFEGERKRGREGRGVFAATFSWLTSAAAVILGVCMLIFQDTFIPLVPVMFGILVAFSALYQFYILAIGARPVLLPGWLYIIPIALVGGAVYIFLQRPDIHDPKIMLATGISLVVFGAGSLIEGILLGNEHRKTLKEKKASEAADAKASASWLSEDSSSHEAVPESPAPENSGDTESGTK